jgi:tetratricopeptide (TPR) repeat protein
VPSPLPLPLTLDHLETTGLITRGAQATDLEYAFKHSLVQETAYGSLLKNRRILLHRQVAEAIESIMPPEDAPAPLLALHYQEAGLPDRAFPYAARAGDEAWRTYAHAEALAHYDRALELAKQLPPERVAGRLRAIYSHRGSVLEVTGRHAEAEANYEGMRQEAARLADSAMEADALNRLATVRVVTFGRAEDARTLLDQALALADRSRDLPLIARTLWNYGLTYRFIHPATATSYLLRALDIVERPDCQALDTTSGIRELEGHILVDLQVTHMVGGKPKAAEDFASRALQVFRSLGNKAMEADALAGLALLSIQQGRPDEGLRLSDEGKAISASIENPWGLVYNGWLQLDVEMDRGHLDRVQARALELLEAGRQVAFPIFLGAIQSVLTRLYLLTDQPDLAYQHAQAALAVMVQPTAPVWAIWGYGTIGLALLSLGRVDEAGQVLLPLLEKASELHPGFQGYYISGPAGQAYALASGKLMEGLAFSDWLVGLLETEGVLRPATDVRLGRAQLRLAVGEAQGALDDLEAAAAHIESAGIVLLRWRCEALRAQALFRLGRTREAAEGRSRARQSADELIAGVRDENLRRGVSRTVAKTLQALEA